MLTFHKIIAGCEAGEGEAWSAFLADYSPLMLQLARIYLPHGGEPLALWRKALERLCGGDPMPLRGFGQQSEREFLAGLRAFFLQQGLVKIGPDDTARPTAGRAQERVAALVRDLPLMHQQVVFLKLAGYSDRTIEQIFRITPAVAQQSLERLRGDYGAWLGREQDICPWPREWLNLLQDVGAAKTEGCPPARMFLRIQDGQAGWQEKEPAEQHVAQCLHCLEAWTALKEISYWRAASPPVLPQDIQSLLPIMHVRKAAAKPRGLFRRILG